MATTAWQQRIRRAEHLAAQHPFAEESLGFYIHPARFQEVLSHRSERAGGKTSVSPSDPDLTNLAGSFPASLSLVEEKPPAPLAQVAHDLRNSDPHSWTDLFTEVWTHIDSPTDPQEFLVLAFLQPYAEFARAQANLQLGGYTPLLCPFFHRKPALRALRQQGDGGRRSLLCGFCLTEWQFRRLICAEYREHNHATPTVYTPDEL